MKKALMLALALGTSSSLAAPFVYPAAWTAEANTANKRGGEFRNYTISDFKGFNPFTTSEATSISGTMESGAGLFTQDPANDKFIPKMAEAMPVISNGGKRFVVKIRQGMKFSDGQASCAAMTTPTRKPTTPQKAVAITPARTGPSRYSDCTPARASLRSGLSIRRSTNRNASPAASMIVRALT